MTVTLEISQELEQEIEEQARNTGLSVTEYIVATLREKVHAPTSGSRVAIGFGKFAGRGRSVDDFLAERHEDAAN